MSRHLWWSDILFRRSQDRGLDSLRFTAAPRYPFQQLKSSFTFRCALHLQHSILHALRLGTSRVPDTVPNSSWQRCGIRLESPTTALFCAFVSFTHRHKHRTLPGRRKTTQPRVLEVDTIPINTSSELCYIFETKGSEGSTELIFSTPASSGAYIRVLAASLAWPGPVSRTRALVSPDQRVSSLVQQPTH